VRGVAQYKLLDDPLVSGFQSGLRFSDGRVKPAYAAYRMPLWVTPDGTSRLRVYGQLRPLAPGASAVVELQNAPLVGGVFTTVQRIGVRSRDNAFVRKVPRFEGRFRLAWLPPGGGLPLLSREARIPTP